MKNLGTIIMVGLLALAIFVSPVVLANISNGYVNTVDTTGICPGCGPDAATTCMGYGLDTGICPGCDWISSEEAAKIVINILADLSGYNAVSIAAIWEDYNFNTARLINTVALSKVMNITLDEAANIVSQGNLCTYIEYNNIIEEFRLIRNKYASEIREAIAGIGLGNRHRHGNGMCGCRKRR